MQYTEIRKLALEAAAVLIADESVGKLTESFVKAQGAVKRGPHRMSVLIKKLFKREVIMAWPPIGSKKDDFPAGYNGPTDRYNYEEWSENAGKNVKRAGSFINELADHSSARAKHALEELEALAPLTSKDVVEESKIAPRYRALIGDKTKALNLVTMFNNELKAARTLFRDGLRVVQQEYAFERFKSVRVEYDLDADGELTNSPAPIVIVDVANPRKGRNFTVGGFLALDPDKADDNFTSIIGTTKKGADDQTTKKTSKTPKTSTEAMGVVNDAVAFFDNEEHRRAYKLAMTSGKQEDRDAFILAMGDMHRFADWYMSDKAIETRYAELKGAIEAKAKAAA